jgi:hypothetical protein
MAKQGTSSSYGRGCRCCDPCRQAESTRKRNQRSRKRAVFHPEKTPNHEEDDDEP